MRLYELRWGLSKYVAGLASLADVFWSSWPLPKLLGQARHSVGFRTLEVSGPSGWRTWKRAWRKVQLLRRAGRRAKEVGVNSMSLQKRSRYIHV